MRTIAAREATHATLVGERLRAVGAEPRMVVSTASKQAALARFGAHDVSDETKLALVLERYPDDVLAGGPLEVALEEIWEGEARAVLRLIAVAEAATVAWLRAYQLGIVEQRAVGRLA